MKRLLLDTHAFLWWLSGDNTLGSQSQKLIADTDNEIIVSAATVWEIEIKRQLGKLTAPEDIESIVGQCGFLPLPIALFHAQQAGRLPAHHRDPFDRMLIAQAQAEGLDIVTSDSAFKQYGIRIVNAVK
jgi:PIN domain nuclease of toxin-antitoxin system